MSPAARAPITEPLHRFLADHPATVYKIRRRAVRHLEDLWT